jgi:hypothetical protein
MSARTPVSEAVRPPINVTLNESFGGVTVRMEAVVFADAFARRSGGVLCLEHADVVSADVHSAITDAADKLRAEVLAIIDSHAEGAQP